MSGAGFVSEAETSVAEIKNRCVNLMTQGKLRGEYW
jgi:hypothetical protein